MKKLLIALLLLFSLSCAQVPQASVNPRIENAYFASVAIATKEYRTYGSGTIILNKKGHQLVILTAAHVVEAMVENGVKEIYVIPSYSRNLVKVQIHKLDSEADLALLLGFSKEKLNGPYVKVATTTPNLGDTIWTIGSPLGSKWTIGRGILSNFEMFGKYIMYRISADMFFGNSGGGVFNEKNELIGVVNSIQMIRAGMGVIIVPGANFAVSLETIKKFI